MKNNAEITQEEKKTDLIQIFLVVIGLAFLVFSIIYLINYYNENDILVHFPENKKSNDTNLSPNEIGDSIGGILNPIIGITGSVLTFLAFYIQYKANKEQRNFFYIGLNNERKKRLEEKNSINEYERKNHITNIKIFKSLVESMLSNYDSMSDNIEKFLKREENKPLAIHLFNFTTNASYDFFKKLDFKSIYDSIVYSFKDKNIDWESDFIKSLNYLDFYEKLLIEMKKTYKIHSQSKSENLNKLGEEIIKNIGNVLSDKELSTLNGVNSFLAIVYNRTPDNKPIVPDEEFSGPDFEKLQDLFLNEYLGDLQERFKQTSSEKYKEQLEIFSLINKKIWGEEFQSVNYSKHLREVHNKNFVDTTALNFIRSFIEKINIT